MPVLAFRETALETPNANFAHSSMASSPTNHYPNQRPLMALTVLMFLELLVFFIIYSKKRKLQYGDESDESEDERDIERSTRKVLAWIQVTETGT